MSMPRRSSYASVLSGNASANSPSFSHPSRSGFMSHLTHTQTRPVPTATSLAQSTSDQYETRLGASADYWERPYLPHHSTSHSHQELSGAMADDRQTDFLVPSYLLTSRHVERLREKQRSRRLVYKEGKSARSSNAGSLSTSASNMNLHKMVPSHRGMTHEIIERPLNRSEDDLPQLPTRWSVVDKQVGLEVSNDGLDVKFTATGKMADDVAASIRADHPVPRECGVYYFEVTLLGKHKEGQVCIALSGPKTSMNRPPGWEPSSWAYHGDDGNSFCQTPSGRPYGPKFGHTNTVGCGINFRTGCVFFTKDGVSIGTAFHGVHESPLFPSIGIQRPGEHVRANFGQFPFVYDIDGYYAREKQVMHQRIEEADTSHLHKSGAESRLLQELVSQYLAHEGYVETAKAFAGETRNQTTLLLADRSMDTEVKIKEDQDARQRQQIRASILSGDVDVALTLTQEYFPHVLRENENVDFKLKCRKFVEMIRRCNELSSRARQRASSGVSAKLSTANGQHSEFGVFDSEMEIDGREEAIGEAGMEIEGGDETMKANMLTTEALIYGQKLQAEFRDDPRREVKQELENTFALIAYPNAEDSSLAPMLREEGRLSIAEELNSAILVSLGKASASAIERLVQQSEVLLGDLAKEGHGGALVNMQSDYMRP